MVENCWHFFLIQLLPGVWGIFFCFLNAKGKKGIFFVCFKRKMTQVKEKKWNHMIHSRSYGRNMSRNSIPPALYVPAIVFVGRAGRVHPNTFKCFSRVLEGFNSGVPLFQLIMKSYRVPQSCYF